MLVVAALSKVIFKIDDMAFLVMLGNIFISFLYDWVPELIKSIINR